MHNNDILRQLKDLERTRKTLTKKKNELLANFYNSRKPAETEDDILDLYYELEEIYGSAHTINIIHKFTNLPTAQIWDTISGSWE